MCGDALVALPAGPATDMPSTTTDSARSSMIAVSPEPRSPYLLLEERVGRTGACGRRHHGRRYRTASDNALGDGRGRDRIRGRVRHGAQAMPLPCDADDSFFLAPWRTGSRDLLPVTPRRRPEAPSLLWSGPVSALPAGAGPGRRIDRSPARRYRSTDRGRGRQHIDL